MLSPEEEREAMRDEVTSILENDSVELFLFIFLVIDTLSIPALGILTSDLMNPKYHLDLEVACEFVRCISFVMVSALTMYYAGLWIALGRDFFASSTRTIDALIMLLSWFGLTSLGTRTPLSEKVVFLNFFRFLRRFYFLWHGGHFVKGIAEEFEDLMSSEDEDEDMPRTRVAAQTGRRRRPSASVIVATSLESRRGIGFKIALLFSSMMCLVVACILKKQIMNPRYWFELQWVCGVLISISRTLAGLFLIQHLILWRGRGLGLGVALRVEKAIIDILSFILLNPVGERVLSYEGVVLLLFLQAYISMKDLGKSPQQVQGSDGEGGRAYSIFTTKP